MQNVKVLIYSLDSIGHSIFFIINQLVILRGASQQQNHLDVALKGQCEDSDQSMWMYMQSCRKCCVPVHFLSVFIEGVDRGAGIRGAGDGGKGGGGRGLRGRGTGKEGRGGEEAGVGRVLGGVQKFVVFY